MERQERKNKEGIVRSRKMDKTAVVEIERLFSHPMYKKSIKKLKKFIVHDEGNITKAGDRVIICETRPLSKNKRWRIERVISK